MSQDNQTNLLNDPTGVGFWARIFRSRCLLQYWLGHKMYSVYVTNFKEKSDTCIVYDDYVTKRTTVIKSDRPITYTLTVEK